MRSLTIEEIERFASRKDAKRIAVENFLSTMGTNKQDAVGNVELDSRLYGWNRATEKAILAGIKLASKG